LKREKNHFFWSKNRKNVKKQRFWVKKRSKMRFPTWRPESLKLEAAYRAQLKEQAEKNPDGTLNGAIIVTVYN